MAKNSSIKTNLILVSVGITSALMFALYLGAAGWYISDQHAVTGAVLSTQGAGMNGFFKPLDGSTVHFVLIAGFFFLVSVGISGVSAVFLMTRILKPVRKMSATMTRISEGKLNTRLELLPGNDEFSTLATTFNTALDRIENAARFQDQLVSDLSHQLRTPLTSMRGMVEVAMLKEHSKDEYQAILESNLAEIDRITSLVNTMLSLAKLDGHTERMNYTRTDLVGLLDETIRELEPLWDAKAIHFLYRIFQNQGMVEYRAKDTAVPQIPARIANLFLVDLDQFHFKQAVINILDNAYKYSPHGGQISIELYPEIVGEPGFCGFAVTNNGPAIATETLPHMFARFFQNDILHHQSEGSLSDTVSESARGFGLGLSICRRIVEMHQGKIRAFNPVTGGAAFEILLPLERQAVQAGE
jgi:signal transduction histidine kinase